MNPVSKIGVLELPRRVGLRGSIIPGFEGSYFRKILSTQRRNLIAYWPLWEPAGSVAYDYSGNGLHGTYAHTTPKQVGIGDGRQCHSFDGSTSFINMYSAGLAAKFNGGEGTFAIWAKVADAGVWVDGNIRYLARLTVDYPNTVEIWKYTGVGDVLFDYRANGTLSRGYKNVSTTDWFSLVISWSKAKDELKAYYNGVQAGATVTGLGAWVGSLSGAYCVVGGDSITPSYVWQGSFAHYVTWSVPLNETEISRLSRIR